MLATVKVMKMEVQGILWTRAHDSAVKNNDTSNAHSSPAESQHLAITGSPLESPLM